MTEIFETELPGVGKKFKLKLSSGGVVTIISHLDGKRNLYFRVRESSEPVVISMHEDEARCIGGLLAGIQYTIKPAMNATE
jgi:TrkA domain protein